ncbi:hypothetical protein [Roseofilum casamattae]|uniref:Uncharacterized protein n=1 Tax=Roseofilum casamattae BLCC-M143 TaxID=3022442 RepID=A0ABT7BZS1_9CYAN|nr:hypothetical protein [Roseofilum casamattae]MDJ1184710.1 hypothetical protein [Roseofilum casamattae BLCC-M143]
MVIRRRQTKTRISSHQPSRQKKKTQFAASPVIQPKVQRKTAKELPQLKSVIGRHPNPLERLRNSPSVQRKVERGQSNNLDTQQLEGTTRDAIQPLSSAAPTAEQPGATIQREGMESLPQEAMDRNDGLQTIPPLHNETSSHNNTIQRKIVGKDGSDIWTKQKMDDDLAKEANDSIKMVVQMLHGMDLEIPVDSYQDLVKNVAQFLNNFVIALESFLAQNPNKKPGDLSEVLGRTSIVETQPEVKSDWPPIANAILEENPYQELVNLLESLSQMAPRVQPDVKQENVFLPKERSGSFPENTSKDALKSSEYGLPKKHFPSDHYQVQQTISVQDIIEQNDSNSS